MYNVKCGARVWEECIIFFFSVNDSTAQMIESDRLNILRYAKELNNARNENV